ncbi:asparginase [Penicillium brasilianum]|uniref:Asparginase n=1 Tax=Penicillium brasilianum TaxID=104259 RepID=A0A1S9RUX9_PENBI|nr:asparginase [Penicillium brasilianum]
MGDEKQKKGMYAIFVHAGAGYHSREHEDQHLDACRLAAMAGMNFLRNGGTAVDAVEVAIAMMENAVITNAGYGSNLNAKGTVECDASIVDHFGRSGACGAVPSIKNPIMLARKIYDQAYKAPGLQRVPPNLLAGEGAADFAWNHGLVLVPDELLVSPSAKARWESWCKEIVEWEKECPEEAAKDPFGAWIRTPEASKATRLSQIEMELQAEIQGAMRRAPGPSKNPEVSNPLKVGNSLDSDGSRSMTQSDAALQAGSMSNEIGSISLDQSAPTVTFEAPSQDADEPMDDPREGEDMITDTVGAIAIDMFGNIAAGSSSGGIGMKHQGRVGPAALIGIGTHVIPVDPTDPEETAVAAVTSGTGEHIASSFGASTCANRVYFSQRKDRAGSFAHVSDEEAISAMIKKEFADHPAVVNSEFSGSIGILCAKKTVDSIAFHFAHNTESFAVGSMSCYDEAPSCLMSRSPRRGAVAQGGVMIRPPK